MLKCFHIGRYQTKCEERRHHNNQLKYMKEINSMQFDKIPYAIKPHATNKDDDKLPSNSIKHKTHVLKSKL